MKTNSRLQLYPLFRIALLLAGGILAGRGLQQSVPGWVWCSVTCLSLGVAVQLSLVSLRNRIQPSEKTMPGAIAQTLCIFISVFALGAWDYSEANQRTFLDFPDEDQFYHAVVLSSPVSYGRVMKCDLLITDGPYVGKKLNAAFFRGNPYSEKFPEVSWLKVGAGIRVRSRLESPVTVRSHRNFDYGLWMKVHGYIGSTFISGGHWRPEKVDLSELSYYQRTVLAARQFRQQLIGIYHRSGMQGQEAAVIAAMTLGDKSGLDRDTRTQYSVAGVSHVLSLSGLHLGILYGMLLLLFGRRNRWWRQILVLVAIWTFVVLAGASTSIIRSAVMVTVYAFCSLLNRDKMSLNAWSLALVTILLYHPLFLYDVGFEMSFLSVLFMILGFRLFPVKRQSHTWPSRVKTWLVGMVFVSIIAQMGTFPLVLYYFGRFSCYFLPANLIVVPLSTMMLYLMAIGFLLLVFPPVSNLFFWSAYKVSGGLQALIGKIASLPGASIEGIWLNEWQLLLIYVVFLGIFALFFVTLHPK